MSSHAPPAPAAGVRDDAGELAGDAGGAPPPPPPGDASSPAADPRIVATTNPRFDVARRTATTSATSAPSSAAGDAPNGAASSFDFDLPFAGVFPFARGVFGVFGGMVPTVLDPRLFSDIYAAKGLRFHELVTRLSTATSTFERTRQYFRSTR